MDHELIDAVTALAERLVDLAAQDDDLRYRLRALAGAVLTATGRQAAISVRMPVPGGHGADGEARVEPELVLAPAVEEVPQITAAVPQIVQEPLPLPELTLGRSRPPEPEPLPPAPATSVRPATSGADLATVEAHCRLKAEGIRWAVTRRRLKDEGADFRVEIAPKDRDILDRAGDIGCYLWMNSPDFASPGEPASLEGVAGWFEAVADAVALVRGMLPDVEANREFFEPALDLVAEAQSALRVVVERINRTQDPDQYRAYDWLRGVASREQIYIRRHMRLDDPADPAAHPDFDGRLEDLDKRFDDVRGRARGRKSAMSRLRYHAKLIGEGTEGLHHWRKVAGAIDELLGLGVPASSVDVREVLLPVLEKLPEEEEFSQGFDLVFREIDRYLAGRTLTSGATAADAPTVQVAEVARLLEGKTVLLIGGMRRPEAQRALESAFGLDELIWFETREHESIDVFEPYVARPKVVLVLLAIRWSSHSYEGVKRFCDDHGKPMVRLPGGYGVNQVAAQIVDQCSGQLGGRVIS